MTLEADQVCNALRRAFANVRADAATETWTHAGLRALAELGEAGGMRVDPPRWSDTGRDEGKAGEFLWDLTLSDWPRSTTKTYEFPGYFAAAARSGARLCLVAESEWGKETAPGATGLEVMEDFAKLLAARSELKVMIFGYQSKTKASFEKLSDLMTKLSGVSGDPATYVLYGLDWKTTGSCHLVVRDGRPGTLVQHTYGKSVAKKRA